jgi:hypothetical protein
MIDQCDEDDIFGVIPLEDNSSQGMWEKFDPSTEGHQRFFMDLLEEAEGQALHDFKESEDRFRGLVQQAQVSYLDSGVVDPDLMRRTREARDSLRDAKAILDRGLERTAFKMRRAAFA